MTPDPDLFVPVSVRAPRPYGAGCATSLTLLVGSLMLLIGMFGLLRWTDVPISLVPLRLTDGAAQSLVIVVLGILPGVAVGLVHQHILGDRWHDARPALIINGLAWTIPAVVLAGIMGLAPPWIILAHDPWLVPLILGASGALAGWHQWQVWGEPTRGLAGWLIGGAVGILLSWPAAALLLLFIDLTYFK